MIWNAVGYTVQIYNDITGQANLYKFIADSLGDSIQTSVSTTDLEF